MMDVADIRQSKMLRSFREMEVYKKAFAVSLHIHKTSLSFPQIEQYALADQMRRASKSICANIAEGFGKQRKSKIEFQRFIMIAVGSAHEMLVWIDYCEELTYITPADAESWRQEYEMVIRMLQSLHNNAR